MLSDFITHQCLLHNYSTYSHAKKYTKVKVLTENDICINIWAICTKKFLRQYFTKLFRMIKETRLKLLSGFSPLRGGGGTPLFR